MTVEVYERVNDYELNHAHVAAAKKLEPYFPLFEVFRARDTQMITLVLAAGRSICDTLGTFTYFDLDQTLGYMQKRTRGQVIDYLRKSRWIEYNGVDYEMPDRVKSLIAYLFSSLPRGEMTISQILELSIAEAELTGMYNHSEDEQEEMYLSTLLSALRSQHDKLDRIIQKKDRPKIWHIVTSNEGKEIISSIRKIQKLVKETKSGMFANLGKQQEIHEICSQLIQQITQISAICNEMIGENTRSIGEYITPDMLDAYLASASIEQLATIADGSFASPKQVTQFREETIVAKTKNLFEDQPDDYVEMTPPPQPVSFEEQDFVTEITGNPLDILYHDIVAKMQGKEQQDIDDLLFMKKEAFGMAVYRTGQALKLCWDLQDEPDNRDHRITYRVLDELKSVAEGAVEQMTRTQILCKEEVRDGK